MLCKELFNPFYFCIPIAILICNVDRSEPEFGFAFFTNNMDMRRFCTIKTDKVDVIWTRNVFDSGHPNDLCVMTFLISYKFTTLAGS
jgi:hypothetical protein